MNVGMLARLEEARNSRLRIVIADVPSKSCVKGVMVGVELLVGARVRVDVVRNDRGKYDLYFDLADEILPTQTLNWDDLVRASDVRDLK